MGLLSLLAMLFVGWRRRQY
ncbi:GlyGly-CTERM sorting domain-containing protein [Photobacterium gaetbulicola]|nr:GlyGly-CTERM sorting domain-containing protein [Photobacterium gaetbulicola]